MRRRWGRPYAATSVQKLGAATALLNMHRTIAILHKIRAQSGFARAYPHLRRAKKWSFQHRGTATTVAILQHTGPEAIYACRCAPEAHVCAPETTMLVLKRTIYAPGDVD